MAAWWRDKSGFYFYSLNKMETKIYPLNYHLHIGLMLTISKVFTILYLLCLCGNRECPGSFQGKFISSTFKSVPKCILFLVKLKQKGRAFWSGQTNVGRLMLGQG